MKQFNFLLFLSLFLFGCSSSHHASSPKKFEHFSGGERMGNAVSLFWYSANSTGSPYSASDFIQSDSDGGYQTSYRWQGTVLKELVREGTQLSENVLVPFKLQIRFDKNGDAVYQQYRLDGKVLPLSEESLTQYKNQAAAIVAAVKKQDKQGLELIQGVWHDDYFETCTGQEYETVEFNQTLPGFVVNRLSALDNYIAFLGRVKNNRVYIQDLLILSDEDHDCIERPELIPGS